MLIQEWWEQRYKNKIENHGDAEIEIYVGIWEAAQIFGDHSEKIEEENDILRHSLEANAQALRIKELETMVQQLQEKLSNEQTLRTL